MQKDHLDLQLNPSKFFLSRSFFEVANNYCARHHALLFLQYDHGIQYVYFGQPFAERDPVGVFTDHPSIFKLSIQLFF